MRTHQLETTLRSLALSGMLDTLEARLAQADAGELGHVEFLQSLCEDELARRDAAGITRRVKAARFEQTCSIEDFDFNFNPKTPTARIRDLATLRFIEAGESVILHGPVGVGKTMIAQALGHQACRRGYTVAFTKASRLLADLAGGHADRTWETRLRRWARPTVLVIDDFAMRAFVNGHRDLPTGGHENSPRTAIRSPHGRPPEVPADGHGFSPRTATGTPRGRSSV